MSVAQSKVEQQALGLLRAFERAGRNVRRVVIEGKRIELELVQGDSQDEFDGIDMRYDKA